VHGTGVYYARVSPKGPALERFPDIKKKNKNNNNNKKKKIKKHNNKFSCTFDAMLVRLTHRGIGRSCRFVLV
jgi:hypothetical protein